MCTGRRLVAAVLQPHVCSSCLLMWKGADLMDWQPKKLGGKMAKCWEGLWEFLKKKEKKRCWTEWHKRAEISQGWNGERRISWYWLDYSAKHWKRDWGKWLRDLSLIVFFQGAKSCWWVWPTWSYRPFYCITIDHIISSQSPYTFMSGEKRVVRGT